MGRELMRQVQGRLKRGNKAERGVVIDTGEEIMRGQ
jgi:hypothetical protein